MRRQMIILGLAAVIGCGGISKEKYAAKESEAAKYQQALQDEKGKATALEAKVNEQQQQYAALQQQYAGVQQQNAALQSRASSTQSQLETTAAKLNEQRSEYAKLKDRTIRINERLLFKEGSSQLTAESKRALDSIADAVRQIPDKAILVAGYTDDAEGGKGATTKRWQISTERALAVAKYLTSRGLDPTRIGIAGFGQARPVAANDTLANKALNRRAEIALMPADLELGTVDVSPAAVKQK